MIVVVWFGKVGVSCSVVMFDEEERDESGARLLFIYVCDRAQRQGAVDELFRHPPSTHPTRHPSPPDCTKPDAISNDVGVGV